MSSADVSKEEFENAQCELLTVLLNGELLVDHDVVDVREKAKVTIELELVNN